MACATIFDGFREITEDLNEELYRKASVEMGSGMWLTAFERGSYPVGVGTSSQETVTMANSEPDSDIPAFYAEQGIVDSVNDGHCDITYATTKQGFDTRSYSPEKYGIKGPLLCRDELPFIHNPDEMLGAYLEELKKLAVRIKTNRLREHLISYSTKYVAIQNFSSTKTTGAALAATGTGATMPAIAATSELTKDMLDIVAQYLIYAGGTDPDSNGYVSLGPDGPMFPLLIHPDASRKLLTNNSSIRTDYNYAEPSELLKKWGATRSFFNFKLIPELLPPRYNWDGTQYVRVNTFRNVAASGKGYKAELHPEYIAADYEAAIIPHPKSIKVEYVQPKNSAGGVKFNPANYMFDWTWAQGAFRLGLNCEDPDEKYGRHYAQLRWAIKPVFPEYAVTIIYRRCLQSIDINTCSEDLVS